MTDSEMELHYTSTKLILIEANESCRVPLPIQRCPLTKLTKLYLNDVLTLEDKLELERICSEHISSLVELKWCLPSLDVSGKASLNGITLTSDMLDVVRIAPIQWGRSRS